jgi:carboxypeptidase Q
MKRQTTLLALLFPFVTATALPAVDLLPAETRQAAEAVRDRALKESRAFEWVQRLTDEVGPRLAGSAGDRAAGPWGKALLESLGFVNVRLEPVPVKVWERVAESGKVVAPYPQPLALAALGGSVGTPKEGLEAEVVEVESLEALEVLVKASPDACRGKIVFFNRKMDREGGMNGYGAVVPIRGRGASRAAAAGAVGVLIRSVGTDSNRLPHTGAMGYEAGVPKVPAAAVSIPDADLLSRLVARGKPVRVRFTLDCGDRPDAVSANVVGEVRGRERPDEVVVVSGHLDSWDLGTGAIDDGAGCGIAIEAARLIGASPRRPRRTVRVVLFANEENGLAGGRTYASAHEAELPRHAAAFEADSGAGASTGFSWNAGPDAAAVVAEIARLLEPLKATLVRNGGAGGADVSPLLKFGVPLFGLVQDSSAYFDFHHTANDTLDKVDRKTLDQATAAMAALVYAVADLPEALPLIPEAQRTRRRE